MVEHKFFKDHGDWFIRCPITGGSFSPDVWSSEKYPKNRCPCCDCDISMELRTQRTKKQIAAGVQRVL